MRDTPAPADDLRLPTRDAGGVARAHLPEPFRLRHLSDLPGVESSRLSFKAQGLMVEGRGLRVEGLRGLMFSVWGTGH